MSDGAEKVGRVVGGVVRGAGALVAGTLGVVSKGMAHTSKQFSDELGNGFSQIGDKCFNAAKYCWTGEKTEGEKLKFDKEKAWNQYYYNWSEKLNDFLDDNEALRRFLESKGIDPDYADDPEFIDFMRRKCAEKYDPEYYD